MFNGIIYSSGLAVIIKKNGKNSISLGIKTNLKVRKNEIGSSISCNGVCLTLVSVKNKILFFYVSKETLIKSNFRFIKINDKINLEKSLIYGQKISGHYVQGHVDTVGVLKNIRLIDKSWVIKVGIKKEFIRFLIEKGSIAINGISLTISKIVKNTFQVAVIPHTLNNTNLNKLMVGDQVNIELDIFSKYLTNISK